MKWLLTVLGVWLVWRLSAPKSLTPIYDGLPECEVTE